MQRLQQLIVLVIATAVGGQPAAAATITYLQDQREIHAYGWQRVPGGGLVGGSDTAQPSPDFSVFSRGFSNLPGASSQFSLLDGSGMAARGFALGSIDTLAYGGGYSRFRIVFEIDETTPWILDGALHRSLELDQNTANARVVLSSGATVIYSAALPPNTLTPGSPGYGDPLTVPVVATGEIGPGEYELLIEVESAFGATQWGGFASYDFTFVVPEPGTALLLLVGLLPLGWRRLRSGRQRE